MTPETKKVIDDIFAAHPELDHVHATADGNVFLPKAIDHARYHAQQTGQEIETVYRDGAAKAPITPPEAEEDEAAAEQAAATSATDEDNAANGEGSEGESSEAPEGDEAGAEAAPASEPAPKTNKAPSTRKK
jgi:hypothetical protein